jgi:hypothetical protein
LKRIRPKIRECFNQARARTRALARVYVGSEYGKYVSHATCGDL